MKTFKPLTLTILLCLISGGIMNVNHAQAQSVTSVVPDAPQSQEDIDFTEAIGKISTIYSATIVTDSPPATLKRIPTGSFGNKSLTQALEMIADNFGYALDTKVDTSSVWILRKRYKGGFDIPDVTREECLEFLYDFKKSLIQYDPQVSIGGRAMPVTGSLVSSLNAQQYGALLHSGLPISHLSPSQAEMAKKAALFTYVQLSLTDINRCIRYLEALPDARLAYRDSPPVPSKTDSQVASNIKKRETSKQLFAELKVDGKPISIALFPPETPVSKAARTPENDVRSLSPRFRAPANPEGPVYTLHELANRLKKELGQEITVDESIARKRVCIFGDVKAHARPILEAVANLYGLKLLWLKDGVYLKRPRPIPPKNIQAIGQTVLATYPRPLLMVGQASATKADIDQLLSSTPSRDQKTTEDNAWRGMANYIDASNYYTMADRCAVDFESHFKARFGTQYLSAVLRGSEMTDDENDLLSILLMRPVMDVLKTRFLGGTPEYIQNFPGLILTGRRVQEASGPRFELTYQSRNGVLPPSPVLRYSELMVYPSRR